MKTRIPTAFALALAAGAAVHAFAQPATLEPSPTPPYTYVQEPHASIATGSTGPNAAAAEAIVQALNADAALKGSKVTVLPEEKGILVTGVTPTLKQKAQISNTATQHAGEVGVINVVATEEVWIDGGGVMPATGTDPVTARK